MVTAIIENAYATESKISNSSLNLFVRNFNVFFTQLYSYISFITLYNIFVLVQN